jgi:Ca-activated chloride channel family protein
MEKKIIILLLFPFMIFWHWFEPASKKNQEGISSYQEEKYEAALEHFMSAKGLKPDMSELKSNTASSLYQMKKFKEAMEEFSSIDPEKSSLSKSDFYYNLGNSFFKLNQFDKALKSYKKSLIEDPDDINSKKNFEITLKKIQQQKQQQKKKNQDKNQKKDKEKEEQKKEQQKQKEQKHKNIMQYLNQNEKKQMKKKKRAIGIVKNEKDW